MTRIVIDPEELGAAAGQVEEAAHSYRDVGRALTDLVLPSMPGPLAEAIGAGLSRAGASLEALGERLDAQAYLLRTRATIIDNEAASRLLLNVGNADEGDLAPLD